MCRSPKNELFQPVKGNHAMGAGTPTLMPIIPALKYCLNCRAAHPLRVKMEAPLPYTQSRPMASASSRSSARTTESTGPKISSRATRISGSNMVEHARADHEAVASCGACGAAIEGDLGAFLAADIEVTVTRARCSGLMTGPISTDSPPSVGPTCHRLRTLAEFLDQRFSDMPNRHGDAACHAALAGTTKRRQLDRPDGLVEIRVRHDDQMVLRPAGRLHPLAVPRAVFIDGPRDGRRADERDRTH